MSNQLRVDVIIIFGGCVQWHFIFIVTQTHCSPQAAPCSESPMNAPMTAPIQTADNDN